MAEFTVAAGAARGLMEFAAARGADRAALLARSGIELQDLEHRDSRVAFAKYAALMRAGKELCADPALALHFGESAELAEMSILASLAPASETTVDALAQLNRYASLLIEVDLETADRFQLAPGRGGVWLNDTRLNANAFPELTESSFARIVCSVRSLAAGAGPPPRLAKAVHVTHADPGYRAEYERIFQAPAVFDSDRNAILLDEAFFSIRVPAEAPYARAVLSERAEQLLEELESSRSIAALVEKTLIPMLHTGVVTMHAVAQKLGMSRWTLSRQLKAEGATFEKILDGLRCKLALDYLDTRKLSVNEAAYLVGFSEPAALSRAFKRWTGRSPRAMRAAKEGKGGRQG